MAVSLSKGGNVSLTKTAADDPNTPKGPDGSAKPLTKVRVGLGWDVRTTTGTDFDLDASAIAANGSGQVFADGYFVFFNNKQTPDQSIVHTGDNRTGEGAGDDEAILVDLERLPADVDKVVFPVSIYDAENRSQNFGQVRNAYIRVLNGDMDKDDPKAELARYDLSEDAATETAMVFGEVYRNGSEWKFRAVGTGYASGLVGISQDFGVNV